MSLGSFLELQVFLFTIPVELTKIIEWYVYLYWILESDSARKILDGSMPAFKKQIIFAFLPPSQCASGWLRRESGSKGWTHWNQQRRTSFRSRKEQPTHFFNITKQNSGSGSTCFWASRIRILLSSSKNSKKNLDSYCLVTSFGLFIFEK